MKPLPTLETLFIIAEGELKDFLDYFEHPDYKYRNLEEQFDISTVIPRIMGIKDLLHNRPIPRAKQRELLSQMLLVHHFGCNPELPIYIRNGVPLSAKDLTQEEIQELVQKCRTTYQDAQSSHATKMTAQLTFNALLRETMWRVTRKFPNSTQMLTVLNAAFHHGHLLSENDTGEGKSIMMALIAANRWFKRGEVRVVTDNLELAREGFEEFGPFYDMLGIPRCKKLITSQTGVLEYCYGGINYSDKAQIALFTAKQKLDLMYMQKYAKLPVDLCIDEAHVPLLLDKAQYRYAIELHPKKLDWMFQPLYEFVTSREYQNHDEKSGAYTIRQDIDKARELLLAKAKAEDAKFPPDQHVSDYIKNLNDRQINTWLEAADAARKLQEKVHFVIRHETRGVGEYVRKVCYARILDSANRICDGAEWSHGMHQFLHARLNIKHGAKTFEINPETVPIASMSAHDLIEHHQKNGGQVFGITATTGTQVELGELNKGYQLEANKIPSHLPSKRLDTHSRVKNQDARFKLAMDEIYAHITQHETILRGYQAVEKPQPILVLMGDISSSQLFYDYMCRELLTDQRFQKYKDILTTQLLTTAETKKDGKTVALTEAEVRIRAGVAGTITETPMFGCGTDISPRLELEDRKQNHPDGLYVMVLHLPKGLIDLLQRIGRAGRFGFKGKTKTILTEEELDACGVPAHRRLTNLDAIAYVQEQIEKSERSTRTFNKQLDLIQKHFFERYLSLVEKAANQDLVTVVITPSKQDEAKNHLVSVELQTIPKPLANPAAQSAKENPYANMTIRDVWVKCISNMFVIWQRIVPEKRSVLDAQVLKLQKIQADQKDFSFAALSEEEKELVPLFKNKTDLTPEERELICLRRCTRVLIDETCDIWNNFPDLPKEAIIRQHVVVAELLPNLEKLTKEQSKSDAEVKSGEVEEKMELSFNDVSPDKDYADNCPLAFCTSLYTPEQARKIRSQSAVMCLAQVFDMKQRANESLPMVVGFKKLLTERFKNPVEYPFRKKLIEVFSIAEWSGDEDLQKQLQVALIESCVGFVKEFDAERMAEFKVVTDNNSDQTADENYFSGLVKQLKELKSQLQVEKQKESLPESAVSFVKSLVYDDLPTMIDKMIHCIEEETVLSSSRKRKEAILLARTGDRTYAHNWAVRFRGAVPPTKTLQLDCGELAQAGKGII